MREVSCSTNYGFLSFPAFEAGDTGIFSIRQNTRKTVWHAIHEPSGKSIGGSLHRFGSKQKAVLFVEMFESDLIDADLLEVFDSERPERSDDWRIVQMIHENTKEWFLS